MFHITAFMIMIIKEISEDKDQEKGPKIGEFFTKCFGYYIAICFPFLYFYSCKRKHAVIWVYTSLIMFSFYSSFRLLPTFAAVYCVTMTIFFIVSGGFSTLPYFHRSVKITDVRCMIASGLCGFWNSNSDPHACAASRLPTGTSPQPWGDVKILFLQLLFDMLKLDKY